MEVPFAARQDFAEEQGDSFRQGLHSVARSYRPRLPCDYPKVKPFFLVIEAFTDFCCSLPCQTPHPKRVLDHLLVEKPGEQGGTFLVLPAPNQTGVNDLSTGP